MASYTENLNLLKKDPVADGADTFNIETMLNENWDKIDKAKGEIDASLSNKVNCLNSYTAGDIKQIPKVPGMCFISSAVTGMPRDGLSWLARVDSDGYSRAILAYDGTQQWLRYATDDLWTEWVKITTATSPQEYELPVLDGWVGNIRYSKNQFNEVICQVTLTPGSNAVSGAVLGTLPTGFRPVAFIDVPVMTLVSGNRSVGQLSVGPDGGIGYYGQTVTAGDSNRIYASFSFVAVN